MKYGDGMKVCLVLPSLESGGAEKMVIDLARGLMAKKCQVMLIVFYDAQRADPKNLKQVSDCGIPVQFLGKRPGWDPGVWMKLWRHLKADSPDIVHSHTCTFPYVATIGLLRPMVHIHTMHSLAGFEANGIYRWLLKRMSASGSTHFVTLSPETQNSFRNHYPVQDSHLHCIPNGVDLSAFKCDRGFIGDKEKLTVLSVGRLVEVKNHALVIRAFALVQMALNRRDQLIILGDGPLLEDLRALASGLGVGDRVKFPGRVDDVRPYLQLADVFALPSRYEGVSLALLEAGAAELPILCTATGGTVDVVGQDALTVEDNDLQGMAMQLKKLILSAELRRSYSQRARKMAERYPLSAMVDGYRALYRRCLNERQAHSLKNGIFKGFKAKAREKRTHD